MEDGRKWWGSFHTFSLSPALRVKIRTLFFFSSLSENRIWRPFPALTGWLGGGRGGCDNWDLNPSKPVFFSIPPPPPSPPQIPRVPKSELSEIERKRSFPTKTHSPASKSRRKKHEKRKLLPRPRAESRKGGLVRRSVFRFPLRLKTTLLLSYSLI